MENPKRGEKGCETSRQDWIDNSSVGCERHTELQLLHCHSFLTFSLCPSWGENSKWVGISLYSSSPCTEYRIRSFLGKNDPNITLSLYFEGAVEFMWGWDLFPSHIRNRNSSLKRSQFWCLHVFKKLESALFFPGNLDVAYQKYLQTLETFFIHIKNSWYGNCKFSWTQLHPITTLSF